MGFVDQIDFKKGDGLVPVIVQDSSTNEVLMMAYMNEDALKKTLEVKKACFYSRSRNKFWLKGETSGNFQEVHGIFFDCDNDTILLKVNQVGGAACHTGHKSCFYKKVIDNDTIEEMGELVFDPKEVYGE
ncbi:phosphoribosyl-AMP cyclohydrolase [Thermodesulfobacteriota bacterium]